MCALPRPPACTRCRGWGRVKSVKQEACHTDAGSIFCTVKMKVTEMAGRPPKPTALLELQGTARKDRHASREREPKPAKGGFPAAPEWLQPEGKAEWERVQLAYAESGIVTPLDRGMLATYCQM